tara:strand:+ start:3279 stop:4055 length:777 start_codon:yes stop_codon:yes gene_type:complete
MNKKLVSVVIPSFNRFKYLKNAVESVMNQTYKEFEIIVINDGSTEEEYYQNKLPKNVKIIDLDVNRSEISLDQESNAIINKNSGRKQGRGDGSIRNYGIEAANGEYIAFLDDDDVWLENKLEIQLNNMLDKNMLFSSTEGYFGNGVYDSSKKYPLYNSEKFYKKIKKKYKGTKLFKKGFPEIWDFEFISVHNCIIHSSAVVERELINSIGGYRAILGGEYGSVVDHDLWLGLLRLTNHLYVDEPLVYYDGNHGDGKDY